MKVGKQWLKELVNLQIPMEDLINLIPLRVQGGIKSVSNSYFELDLKGYNRSDLLSLRGVAYEIAAITNSPLVFEEESPDDISHLAGLPPLEVGIQNPKLCPIYCLAKIDGLKVRASSPEWTKKLENSGMRAVNNVADVTNLVMLEYGQPLHAFDSLKVKNGAVIVRTARQGETIETLDGKKRQLTNEDLLISDPEKAIGIAGVMGGKNSEITPDTTSILLEAAIFSPQALRKTATRLGLQSEASKRFYHGLTKTRLLQSVTAGVRYYQELGGQVKGFSIVGDRSEPQRSTSLTLQKTRSLIGVNLSPEVVEEYLKRLYFTVESKTEEDGLPSWQFNIPYWRTDIEVEQDLIEEVARMYGYESIRAKALTGPPQAPVDQSAFELINTIKTHLKEIGLSEVLTYPFYSTQALANLELNLDDLVQISNPISAETQYLQTEVWPNLLESVIKNARQNFSTIALFQIARVYHPKAGALPEEKYHLAVALMNTTLNPIQELYRILLQLSDQTGLNIAADHTPGIKGNNHFHPTRFSVLTKNGQTAGLIAEIHPRIINRFGTNRRIAVAEIRLIN